MRERLADERKSVIKWFFDPGIRGSEMMIRFLIMHKS